MGQQQDAIGASGLYRRCRSGIDSIEEGYADAKDDGRVVRFHKVTSVLGRAGTASARRLSGGADGDNYGYGRDDRGSEERGLHHDVDDIP